MPPRPLPSCDSRRIGSSFVFHIFTTNDTGIAEIFYFFLRDLRELCGCSTTEASDRAFLSSAISLSCSASLLSLIRLEASNSFMPLRSSSILRLIPSVLARSSLATVSALTARCSKT